MAGWLFMLAGLLVVVLTLAGAPPWLTHALLVAAGLIPYGYSLVIYQQLALRLSGRRLSPFQLQPSRSST